jgi:hypothetical protein
MARAAKSTKEKGGRASKEAVEKRRVARRFNDLLTSGDRGSKLDGRTEKRRSRLLEELEHGATRSGRELKPIDVLLRVSELIELGETWTTLRRRVAVRRTTVPDDELARIVAELHRAYAFPAVAYRFVGVSDEVLRLSGVLSDGKERPRRRRAA